MSRQIIDHSYKENQATIEDDSYFPPKSQKGTQRGGESRIQSRGHVEDLSHPLFQLEMKFDSLKNYVDSVTTAVNQHATILNKLKSEMQLRLSEKQLVDTINKFSKSIISKDFDPNFMITAVNDNNELKEGDDLLDNSITKFCSKLESFSNGFANLKTLNEKLQEVESNIGKKISGMDVKTKVKKAKVKIRGEIENNNKKLEDKIKSLEKKYSEKVGSLENKLLRIEHTPKEDNLNRDEYSKKAEVASLAADMELKIIKEINSRLQQFNELNQEELKEIKYKLQNIEEESYKKIFELENKLNDIGNRSKTPIYKDLEEEILSQIAKGIKKFSTSFEDSYGYIQNRVEIIDKNLLEFQKKDKLKEEESRSLNSFNQLDLEASQRLLKIEESTVKTKNDINRINEQIQNITRDFKEKIGRIETEVSAVDVEQKSGENRLYLPKAIEDLEQKLDKINHNFDRKIAKLKKEFDLETLIKQFKSKANEGDVQKGFENIDTKIIGLNDSLIVLKRELDSLSRAPTPKNTDNAFISIKSALPKACLSCGSNSLAQQQTSTSFMTRKIEQKLQLKEKEKDGSSSIDRPSTATQNKIKMLTAPSIKPNITSSQGFGTSHFRMPPMRTDSLK